MTSLSGGSVVVTIGGLGEGEKDLPVSWDRSRVQAGAELGQAQAKLELD